MDFKTTPVSCNKLQVNKLQLIRKNTNLSWINQFHSKHFFKIFSQRTHFQKDTSPSTLNISEDKNLFQMVAFVLVEFYMVYWFISMKVIH